jgi:hypothetical protein
MTILCALSLKLGYEGVKLSSMSTFGRSQRYVIRPEDIDDQDDALII